MSLHSSRAGADRLERATWLVFALGGLAIVLSLVGATWATMRYRDSGRWVALRTDRTPPVSTAENRSASMARVLSVLPKSTGNAAFATVGWNELTLMLRTGLSDNEVITAVSGKQLATSVGPTQERLLRGLGAGDRLIRFLRAQPYYGAPSTEFAPPRVQERVVITGAALPRPMQSANILPAVAAPPPVDYAAKDRQIARLKQKVDELDEQMRVLRTNPRDSRYWWHYGSWRGIDQLQYDAYMKQVDTERNELRRQKWQLEGR